MERRRRTGRSRCSRRSAGPSPGGPASPGWSRAGCPAIRARPARPAGPERPRRGVTASASSRLDPTGRRADRPFVHGPYAIVRPQMQTSLARRQRHRRALQRSPEGATRAPSSRGSLAIVLLLILLGIVLLAAAGLLFAVGAYNYYADGPARPRGRPDQPRVRAADRSSTTGPARSSSPASASSSARSSRSTSSPARCSTRRPRSRTRTSGATRASTRSASSRPASTPSPASPAAPRRSPSSSSAPRLLPPEAFEGSTYERKIREIIQSIRLTEAYPGRGRQAGRSSPPTSTRTSTATRATA